MLPAANESSQPFQYTIEQRSAPQAALLEKWLADQIVAKFAREKTLDTAGFVRDVSEARTDKARERARYVGGFDTAT
jgi:hypothetical protein